MRALLALMLMFTLQAGAVTTVAAYEIDGNNIQHAGRILGEGKIIGEVSYGNAGSTYLVFFDNLMYECTWNIKDRDLFCLDLYLAHEVAQEKRARELEENVSKFFSDCKPVNGRCANDNEAPSAAPADQHGIGGH